MPGGPLMVYHDRSWLVLIFGLIITGAVVIYIRSSRRHASRIMRVNQKIFVLAQLDPLTSLANRRAFIDRLNVAFAACGRGSRPFAVLYFDLDRFKDVNDTLGHAIGDALLWQVAARIKSVIRGTDVAARFGGDEFAILQSDVDDPSQVGTLAAKLREVIAEPYFIDRQRSSHFCQHRDLALYAGCPWPRCYDDTGRPRALSRQGGRPQLLPVPQRRPRSPGAGARSHRGRTPRRHRAATSSNSTISRKSSCARGGLSVSKLCCAGTIPNAARFRPRCSFRLRSGPDKSNCSDNGCSMPRVGNCGRGKTICSRRIGWA